MKRQSLTAVWLFALALLTAAAGRAGNPICDAMGKNCGEIDDGMGGKVDCGTCPPPDTCGGSGIPNVCGCKPRDCTGLECGTIDRGCGKGPLECGGKCLLPKTCGGGGIPNICGCTPKTCGSQNCGTIDPGCGLPPVSCGQCSGANVCNAGSCCTPQTCGSKNCGTIDRGCGLGPVSCGSCSGVCLDGSCCIPETCGNRECGSIEQGCRLGRKSCGRCGSSLICVGGFCEPGPDPTGCTCGGRPPACQICPGLTKVAPHDPSFCAAQGKNCGLIDDGDGGKVDCGTCRGKQTCGGGGVPNVCGRPDTKER